MRSRLVAFSFYPNNTNTGRERCATRKLRQCHVHLYHSCIYAKRARHTPAEHLPERTAQTCYFHMSIHFLSSIIYAKESDILRSKPNVVSVCRGVYRSLFPVKLQLCVVALWRALLPK